MFGYSPSSDFPLSKFVCYLCRHGAAKHGLAMDGDGWLEVLDVLDVLQTTERFREKRRHDLLRLVKDSAGGRLELSGNEHWIRAVQGHSLPVSDDGLFERVTVEDLPALIIHGTTEEAWLMIRTQGISPMSRQHVHLATTAAQVKRHCVVHIYVDTHMFLERGHLLLRARNGLILSRGQVPPEFFAHAWHTRRRIDLLRATDAAWLHPEALSRWRPSPPRSTFDDLYERVTVEDLPSLIIHGTTEEAWLKIRTEGISPMGRHHVSLATTTAQVPGYSTWDPGHAPCDVHIYVDKDMFLERGGILVRPRDGTFDRSSASDERNGLILCRGHITSEFFAYAWHTCRRIDLLRVPDADWLQPEGLPSGTESRLGSGGGGGRERRPADEGGGGWGRWNRWQADAGGGKWQRWSSGQADASGGGGSWGNDQVQYHDPPAAPQPDALAAMRAFAQALIRLGCTRVDIAAGSHSVSPPVHHGPHGLSGSMGGSSAGQHGQHGRQFG